MNPPYRKPRSDSAERSRLSAAGIETSNLYSAFVWLALKLLAGGGELVAITPRSFMNGSYFRPLPASPLASAGLSPDPRLRRPRRRLCRGRRAAGERDLPRDPGRRPGGDQDHHIARTNRRRPSWSAPWSRPSCSFRTIRTVSCTSCRTRPDAKIAASMRRLPQTLAGLGVFVSTGRVVGFRAKERLRAAAGPGDAPLILPGHCAPRVRGLAQGIGNEAECPGRRRPRRRPPATRRLVRPGQPLQCEGRQAPRGRHALRPGAYRRGQRRIRQQAERPAPGETPGFSNTWPRGSRCSSTARRSMRTFASSAATPRSMPGISGRCVSRLPAYSNGWATGSTGSCPRRRRSTAWSGRRFSR